MLALSVLEALPKAAASAPVGPDLTRYLLVCALLVGGIVGVGVLLRRVLGQTLKVRAAKRSLQITDVLPLGGKQRLVVVRCFDRTFLIGQGEKELNPVAELDSLELESMKRLVEEEPSGSFAAALAEEAPAPPPVRPAHRERKRVAERPVLRDGEGVLG